GVIAPVRLPFASTMVTSGPPWPSFTLTGARSVFPALMYCLPSGYLRARRGLDSCVAPNADVVIPAVRLAVTHADHADLGLVVSPGLRVRSFAIKPHEASLRGLGDDEPCIRRGQIAPDEQRGHAVFGSRERIDRAICGRRIVGRP